ncbi:Hypothetical protein P9211_11071 [Prochlorococcus marinus str. MIT 9211]|uniref:Uncharacterized protein n=1 Tax=Prochlorococcus marinus (strain MIT 9211) TaxID=93059 RepID=A9BB26_PROM4|nr:Hypothetical protein P9211_11071 [Prochlorococcus marinus str. MIT 9211]
MILKYPGRTIHFLGVVLLGFWMTAKLLDNYWADTKKQNADPSKTLINSSNQK